MTEFFSIKEFIVVVDGKKKQHVTYQDKRPHKTDKKCVKWKLCHISISSVQREPFWTLFHNIPFNQRQRRAVSQVHVFQVFHYKSSFKHRLFYYCLGVLVFACQTDHNRFD